MKPEKAISIINDYDVYFEGHTAEEIVDAMELAIEALQKQIPKPVEQTHVLRTETHAVRSDTISRQAAIRWVKTECNPYGKPTLDFESGKKVIEHLEQMPAAQPKKVIPHRNYKYLSDYWCECGWHLGKKGEVKYCSGCGRKVNWDGRFNQQTGG